MRNNYITPEMEIVEYTDMDTIATNGLIVSNEGDWGGEYQTYEALTDPNSI